MTATSSVIALERLDLVLLENASIAALLAGRRGEAEARRSFRSGDVAGRA